MKQIRRITPFERKVQRIRIWLLDATDEKVIGAALLFLLACELWWVL